MLLLGARLLDLDCDDFDTPVPWFYGDSRCMTVVERVILSGDCGCGKS